MIFFIAYFANCLYHMESGILNSYETKNFTLGEKRIYYLFDNDNSLLNATFLHCKNDGSDCHIHKSENYQPFSLAGGMFCVVNENNAPIHYSFWIIDDNYCPLNSFVMKTTDTMRITMDYPRFCMFCAPRFNASSLSISSDDIDIPFNFKVILKTGMQINASLTKSMIIKEPFLLVGNNKWIQFSKISIEHSILPVKGVVAMKKCSLEPILTLNTTNGLPTVPQSYCVDLSSPALNVLVYTLIAIALFTALIVVFNKFGCIDVMEYLGIEKEVPFEELVVPMNNQAQTEA